MASYEKPPKPLEGPRRPAKGATSRPVIYWSATTVGHTCWICFLFCKFWSRPRTGSAGTTARAATEQTAQDKRTPSGLERARAAGTNPKHTQRGTTSKGQRNVFATSERASTARRTPELRLPGGRSRGGGMRRTQRNRESCLRESKFEEQRHTPTHNLTDLDVRVEVHRPRRKQCDHSASSRKDPRQRAETTERGPKKRSRDPRWRVRRGRRLAGAWPPGQP